MAKSTNITPRNAAFEKKLDNNVEAYDKIQRSSAGGIGGRTFVNTQTNISVYGNYSRSDYDCYRPNERVPTKDEDIIFVCNRAYERIGIVHNVIDLMADFTVQGIRIVHQNKKIEKFYKSWAKTIDFTGFSERICNTLYRLANCPIQIRNGKVPLVIEDDWKQGQAGEDIEISRKKEQKRTIPLAYNIMNPLSLEIVGGELASIAGKQMFRFRISSELRSAIHRMATRDKDFRNQEDRNFDIKVSPDFIRAVMRGDKSIPIDPDKFTILYYKKDDWRNWALPMIYPILENLFMLEKMHLADTSALDGAISQVRVWTMGNLEAKILPTSAAINKLRNILTNIGGGVLDLVWGPELTFKESSTNVHQFLGDGKYKQVMSEIYDGLGIPPSLTAGGDGQGFTNNAISMKALVERLEYGRRILADFWDKELRKIQKAMGWRFPAKVVFDHQVLSDKTAELNLLLSLWDRNIVSTEGLLNLFDQDPDLEKIRVNRERREIENGRMPEKAGPYHNAQGDLDLRKIFAQSGQHGPAEFGIELEPAKEGETTRMEQMEQTQLKLAKFKPTSNSDGGDGRPKNTKDTNTRKKREDKPKTVGFAELIIWANEAQKQIAEIINPAMLDNFNKKNMRSLNKDEVIQVERLKLLVLSNLAPYADINHNQVYNILDSNAKVDSKISTLSEELYDEFQSRYNKQPTLEEVRQIQACAYAMT